MKKYFVFVVCLFLIGCTAKIETYELQKFVHACGNVGNVDYIYVDAQHETRNYVRCSSNGYRIYTNKS